MIVNADDLPGLSGPVAMVDGGFDPLHAGHIAYFAAAAQLGVPVLCNLTPDGWIERKHPPLLPQHERAAVIDAIRHIAYTHPSRTSTRDVLAALRPRFYVKGADWRGRLPEEERETCRELGVEIVYLDTVTNSSSAVLRDYLGRHAAIG